MKQAIMPTRPTSKKWAICMQIAHHLEQCFNCDSYSSHSLARSQLGEGIEMIDEAIRLLKPELATGRLAPVKMYRTVLEMRAFSVGHYDEGDYRWAAEPIVSRIKVTLAIAANDEVVEALYALSELLCLAMDGAFEQQLAYEQPVLEAVKLFQLVSNDVAAYPDS